MLLYYWIYSNCCEKAIKCWAGLAFYRFFSTGLINSIKHEHSCYSLYISSRAKDLPLHPFFWKALMKNWLYPHSSEHLHLIDEISAKIMCASWYLVVPIGRFSEDFNNSFHGAIQSMGFPTMWYVRPAKAQTSLRIRAVWSEPLLVAWMF